MPYLWTIGTHTEPRFQTLEYKAESIQTIDVWSASDWLRDFDDKTMATKSDEDLEKMADDLDQSAKSDDCYIHGGSDAILEVLTRLRAEAQAEQAAE